MTSSSFFEPLIISDNESKNNEQLMQEEALTELKKLRFEMLSVERFSNGYKKEFDELKKKNTALISEYETLKVEVEKHEFEERKRLH